MLKLAAPAAPSFVQRTLDQFLGRNVENAYAQHYKRVMQLPFVRTTTAANRGRMEAFKTFLDNALRGGARDIVDARELPVGLRTAGRRQLIKAMKAGQEAVGAERAAAWRARLGVGGGVAAPIAGGIALSGGGEKTADTGDDNALLPSAVGIGVGALPTIHGIHSGALRLSGEPEDKLVSSFAALRKQIQPGDILLTGDRGTASPMKPVIALTGGDPYGYHVEVATGKPAGAVHEGIPITHSTSGAGGAHGYMGLRRGREDVIIKRFINKKHVAGFLKNIGKARAQEDVLAKMLGPTAASTMYDSGTAIGAGVKSLLPASVQRLFCGSPQAGKAVCSTLPAMASPVELAPGIPRHEVLPHHISTSPKLKTVAHYRTPRSGATKLYEKAVGTLPWVLRAGIGAGLGYGAYRGIKALTEE